jgi:hypothetical protein
MRAFAAALVLMAIGAAAYSQNLEQQEQLNQIEKAVTAIDDLAALTDKMGKEKRHQCMTAVANEPFCECLGEKLPVVINFLGYVHIVTQTKEELKYNTLSAEDKRVVDNTRNARDQCLKARR